MGKINWVFVLSFVGLFSIFVVIGYFFVYPFTGNFILKEVNYGDANYAVPLDVFNNNASLFNVSPEYIIEENFNLKVNISHEGGVVYRRGYIYDFGRSQWEVFYLNGTFIGISPWISESASTSFDLDSSNFLRDGLNYVVAYSCKKYGGTWKCGCNSEDDCGHWMLQVINVSGISNPAIPSCVNDSDCGPGGECYKGVCRKIPEPPEGVPIHNCEELQNISNNLSGIYYLANDIDCSETKNWNDGRGFEPIGTPGCGSVCAKSVFENWKEDNVDDYNYFYERLVSDYNYFYESELGALPIEEIKSMDEYIKSEGGVSCLASYYSSYNFSEQCPSSIFSGRLDGRGKEIENLFIFSVPRSSYSNYGVPNYPNIPSLGLFAATNGLILNLGLTNLTLESSDRIDSVVGGISGAQFGGAISKSFVQGSIFGGTRVGSVVGFVQGGDISSVYTLGNVSGLNMVGGLVGNVNGFLNIFDSYSSAFAKTFSRDGYSSPQAASGLVGTNSGGSNLKIINSFFVGNVSEIGPGDYGLLVGLSISGVPNISNSYYLSPIAPIRYCYGSSYFTPTIWGYDICSRTISPDYFKSSSNAPMSSWDFIDTWAINSSINNGYPYLRGLY